MEEKIKPKIGFLSIAHKDYSTEVSYKFAEEAVKNIKACGVDVVFSKKSLTDMIAAQDEAKNMSRQDIIGIIIFLETWVECSTAFNGCLSSNTLKPGKITFGRLIEGIGCYKFIYGTGEGIEAELRQKVLPAAEIILDGSVEKLINSFPSQHYALCYGDISMEIEGICKILNIETIKI